jgi:hypothetical protein
MAYLVEIGHYLAIAWRLNLLELGGARLLSVLMTLGVENFFLIMAMFIDMMPGNTKVFLSVASGIRYLIY